ncbi:hypothetical protein IFG57_003972 [Salmonella enterica]|nr:hypothetical protein [Salmonella enterica]
MKMKFAVPLVCLCTLSLAACNDPKKPSYDNFKNAAQEYLNTMYPACYIKANFPYKTDGISFNNLPDLFHAMAEKGLLSEKELSRQHVQASWGSDAHDVVVNLYDLTEEGKKFYKKDAAKNMRGDSIGGFCFGKATVTNVSNFTEPSDAMGQKISRVSFSYKVTDIPAWAMSDEITTFEKKLQKDVNSDKSDNTMNSVFLLTNKGWIHEKLFGK